MIVDDEPWVREGLLNSISWNELGIELTGSASNGRHALELFSKTLPDIVLTDIKMPEMDGLEFTKEALMIRRDAYILLMSAYNEFEYARKAIGLGAKDYILKPFGKEEIMEVIKKARIEIEQSARSKKDMEKLSSIVKEKLLKDLLFNKNIDLADIKEKCVNIGTKLHTGKLVVIVFKISHHCNYTGNISESTIYSNILKHIIMEITQYYDGIITGMDEKDLIAGILQVGDTDLQENLSKYLTGTFHKLKKTYNADIYAGISDVFDSPINTYSSYAEAVTALNYAILKKKEYSFFSKIVPDTNSKWIDFSEFQSNLENLIKSGNIDSIQITVNEFFEKIVEADIYYCYTEKDLLLQIVAIPLSTLCECGYGVQDVLGGKYLMFDYLNQLATIEDFKIWFSDFAVRASNCILQNNINVIRKDIKTVKEYIEANYNKNITLEDLSKLVMFSPSYLSKLFKEEIGISYTKYLTGIRISRSKELLSDYGMKIYEISYAVGYSNVKHFVTLFKKHTGISPSEYRDKICSRG